MVECGASDPEMWVRFPLPAPRHGCEKDVHIQKIKRVLFKCTFYFFNEIWNACQILDFIAKDDILLAQIFNKFSP